MPGDLQKIKDSMSKELYGMTPAEAQAKGICVECKQPAAPKIHSEAGRREYKITGICEQCWDHIFADREDA